MRDIENSSRSPIHCSALDGIGHNARLDRCFEPLRIAVGAHRQRRACELQQTHEISADGHGRKLVVIVCVIIVMMVIMDLRCAVLVPGAAVRTGFGLERRRRAADLRAKTFEHPLQHVIVAESQISVADFNGHMAVAEVIRDFRQRGRRLALQHAARSPAAR